MKLTEVLTEDLVKMDLEARTRDGAIRELVQLLSGRGKIAPADLESVVNTVLEREHLGSTAIGRGVAIPHAKTPAVREFVAAFGRSRAGIDFSAVDGEPVHLVFILISPPDSQRAHLKALAHISRLLSKQDLRAHIMAAKSPAEIIKLLSDEPI